MLITYHDTGILRGKVVQKRAGIVPRYKLEFFLVRREQEEIRGFLIKNCDRGSCKIIASSFANESSFVLIPTFRRSRAQFEPTLLAVSQH